VIAIKQIAFWCFSRGSRRSKKKLRWRHCDHEADEKGSYRLVIEPDTWAGARAVESATMIRAQCHTVDEKLSVTFDAAPWFSVADAESIIHLAQQGWSSPSIADALQHRRVSERMCKQVSVSLPLKGDSHDDQHDDCTGTAGSTAC